MTRSHTHRVLLGALVLAAAWAPAATLAAPAGGDNAEPVAVAPTELPATKAVPPNVVVEQS